MICHWFFGTHGKHWFGVRIEGHQMRHHMHCLKCGRWWFSKYNAQPDPFLNKQNLKEHNEKCQAEYALTIERAHEDQ
jgi:hypothetical protein